MSTPAKTLVEKKPLALTVINGNQPRPKKILVKDNAPATMDATMAERKEALAKAEAALRAANCAVGEGFWDLGQFAKCIRDRRLFVEAGCTTFGEYIKKLGYTATHVYNAIAVSEGMPREQAGRIGVACSVAITKAPESAKGEVAKLAEMGVPPAKVREHARAAQKAARAASGAPAKGRPAKAGRPRDIRADLESAAPQAEHDAKVDEEARKAGAPEPICGECQVTKEPGLMLVSFSALGHKWIVRVKEDKNGFPVAVYEAGK